MSNLGNSGDGAANVRGLEDIAEGLRGRQELEIDGDGFIHLAGSGNGATGDENRVVNRVRPSSWAEAPWYERKPGRLATEQEAMTRSFPSFRIVLNDDGTLSWVGVLKPVQGLRFVVELRYPACYPASAPSAIVLKPTLEPSPHQYGGGALCLMYQSDAPHRDQHGRLVPTDTWLPTATAATLVPVISTWLAAYEHHRRKCRRDRGTPCIDNKCEHFPGPKHTFGGFFN